MTQGADSHQCVDAAIEETFQISRYPATLIDVWTNSDGRKLMLRPVLPQDGPLLADLIDRLSPLSRRYRFHGAVKGLKACTATAMTTVDYTHHMAFVVSVLEADGERVIADARWCVDKTGDGAEFGLVVDDQWHRQGLGKKLMQALFQTAKDQGLNWLHGRVVQGNGPMLTLMTACGFSCTPDRHEGSMMYVETSLRPADASRRASSWRKLMPWLWRRKAAAPVNGSWSMS